MKYEHKRSGCYCLWPQCKHRRQEDAEALRILHSDFTSEMRTRFMGCHAEGKHGWDSSRVSSEAFRLALLKNLDEEDYIDAANHIMFLWNRQEPKP